MKYNESNPPLVCMQTQSTCYKGTGKMKIKGILWHDTGANNPNLKRYIQLSDNAPDRAEWLEKLGKNTYKNDWNHVYRKCGMNCWIGKLADGSVHGADHAVGLSSLGLWFRQKGQLQQRLDSV